MEGNFFRSRCRMFFWWLFKWITITTNFLPYSYFGWRNSIIKCIHILVDFWILSENFSHYFVIDFLEHFLNVLLQNNTIKIIIPKTIEFNIWELRKNWENNKEKQITIKKSLIFIESEKNPEKTQKLSQENQLILA